MTSLASPPSTSFAHTDAEREAVLRLLAAASFLVFFQSYLVAPLIPALTIEFHATSTIIGLLVPAYLLPYGLSTLFYGPLSDRIGRRPVLLVLMAALALFTAGTALAHSAKQLLVWRMLAGVSTGGIIPIALALLADLFPYTQRGRAIGWIFGAIAGGMAFGSTLGAFLNPLIGWRATFVGVGLAGAVLFGFTWRMQDALQGTVSDHPPGLAVWIHGYRSVLATARARRTYACILLNGMFHAGIFAWLGVYFSRRYGLGDEGIGLALLGYGVPGMLLGPTIGHAADRVGRRVLIPVGLLLSAVAGLTLAPHVPLLLAAGVVTLLSFGLDMSHPLLTGIITSIDPRRAGQALGLNAFILFTGFGLGSLLFQWLWSSYSFFVAFTLFAIVEFLLAGVSTLIFRNEFHSRAVHP